MDSSLRRTAARRCGGERGSRRRDALEVVVVVGGQRDGRRFPELLLVPRRVVGVDVELGRRQRGRLDEVQVVVAAELARQPKKRLLEVVVRLGRNVVVLQVLLAVERNLLRLDLAVLDLHLVARQHDRDVLADARQVAVPVWYILVRDSAGDVEHDDGALALDVVAVAQAAEALLARRVPDIEFDRSAVGVEDQRVDLDAERSDVLLLELARQVALDERRLPDAAVADEDQLKLGHLHRHCCATSKVSPTLLKDWHGELF
eukprot:CAMPEP_0184243558 /NCGR_PEP_ID=MMETSP0977-20130417/337_1 /TAXON_ID=483370 /ORGANISM="non described non described, Strain CCMP2097" /LENGTH=259 /DNA_ID=CAMNT_0026548827 /DNA_START=101 /DNA_END=877 /DNA_ORIENTATION=-